MPADWPCPSISPANTPPHATASAPLDSCGHLPTGPRPQRSPDSASHPAPWRSCLSLHSGLGACRGAAGSSPSPGSSPRCSPSVVLTDSSHVNLLPFSRTCWAESTSGQHPRCPCCLEISAPLPLIALGKFSGSHTGPWTNSFAWEFVSNAVVSHGVCVSHLPFILFQFRSVQALSRVRLFVTP